MNLLKTTTAVHSHGAEKQARATAEGRTQQALGGVLLFCQPFLYATLVALPRAGAAAWWLTLSAVVPAVLFWLAARLVVTRLGIPGLLQAYRFGKQSWAAIPLFFPLLILDGTAVLWGLCQLLDVTLALPGQQKSWLVVTLAAVFLALCLGGGQGVGRLAYYARLPLLAALAVCLLAVLPESDLYNMHPLLGVRREDTFSCLLLLPGAGWCGVVCFFAGGQQAGTQPRFPFAAVVPVLAAAAVLWCFCAVLPTDYLVSPTTWGQRMVSFLKGSFSRFWWECLVLVLAFAFLTCLTGLGSAARSLGCEAGLWPLLLPFVLLLLCGGTVLLAPQQGLEEALARLLPYRSVWAAIALLPGLVRALCEKGKGK